MIALSAAMPEQLAHNSIPDKIRIPMGMLGALSAVGAFVLWFGMLWNCLFFSEMRILPRVGWFLLIMFRVYVGSVIYYFVKYRSQEKHISTDLRASPVSHDY